MKILSEFELPYLVPLELLLSFFLLFKVFLSELGFVLQYLFLLFNIIHLFNHFRLLSLLVLLIELKLAEVELNLLGVRQIYSAPHVQHQLAIFLQQLFALFNLLNHLLLILILKPLILQFNPKMLVYL